VAEIIVLNRNGYSLYDGNAVRTVVVPHKT